MNGSETGGRTTPDVVLYGGKGGVGKTTCAAAHALSLAASGAETLVLSTDPAHSLGDALDLDLGAEPAAVTDSLSALEVDAATGQAAFRGVVEALVEEFRDAGLRLDEDDLGRLFEAGLLPGGDEVAALEYVARYAVGAADPDTDRDEPVATVDSGGGYDAVVLDTAPTGHTLRLLDLPAVLAETLGVAGDVQRRVRRTARAARSFVVGPAAYLGAGEDDGDAVSALRDRIDAVGALLRDPERTAFRVVLTPERMAIAETERLLDRLADADVPVDALVVNRLFGDDDCGCDRCRRDARRHADRLRTVEERFDRPVLVVPELGEEPRGLDALRAVGDRLVG